MQLTHERHEGKIKLTKELKAQKEFFGPKNPVLYKLLDLGFSQIMVDSLWLKIIQEHTVKKVTRGNTSRYFYDFNLIRELDPAFFEVYYAGGNLLAVINDDGTGARKLLLHGELFRKAQFPYYSKKFQNKNWPYQWRLALILGYVELYELDNMPRAAQAFNETAIQEGSPSYLKNLVERLSTIEGRFDVAFRLINFLTQSSKNPEVQKRLKEKLSALKVSYKLYSINQKFQNYIKTANRKNINAKIFLEFLDKFNLSKKDSSYGELFLDDRGKIRSTLKIKKTFGLDY